MRGRYDEFKDGLVNEIVQRRLYHQTDLQQFFDQSLARADPSLDRSRLGTGFAVGRKCTYPFSADSPTVCVRVHLHCTAAPSSSAEEIVRNLKADFEIST